MEVSMKKMIMITLCFLMVVTWLGCAQTKKECKPEAINAAAKYCIEHEGKSETRKNAAGVEVGVCVFSDGSVCEEWAYYRGKCQPGSDLFNYPP